MPPIDQIINPAIQAGNALTQLIQEEIAKLSQEQAQYAQLQSSLDIIRRRHNLELSYISQFTNWYGSKTWYERGGFAILVASVSILVGAIMSAIEAAIAISMSLYFLVTYIADNHYTTTLNQDAAFVQDVVALEAQLKTLFDSLNEYNEKIKTLFAELFSNYLEVSEQLTSLEESNVAFQEEISKFKAAVVELEEVVKQLRQDNAMIIESRGKTGAYLKSMTNELATLHASYKAMLEKKINAQNLAEPRPDASPISSEAQELLERQRQLRAQCMNKPFEKRLSMFGSSVLATDGDLTHGDEMKTRAEGCFFK